MSEDKDYSAQHSAILDDERQNRAKNKAHAEALEKNFKNFVEQAMKNPQTKKNLGKEAMGVGEAAQRGQGPKFDKYDQGLNGGVVEEEFTGFNEERPWERDTDEE